jgi:hypothetical protein
MKAQVALSLINLFGKNYVFKPKIGKYVRKKRKKPYINLFSSRS